ncbi:hypothetical protein AN958_01939 [Leucoagaricus sp. SymC.cos]|nr:hypothetical protein AN958_01939 [Leucoagaricus sp. SymC.cos]
MEIPRHFYKQHITSLTRYVTAETYDGLIFLMFIRGQKQIVFQFKVEDMLLVSEKDRDRNGDGMKVWPWIHEIANYPKSISWEPSAGNWCYISRSKKRGHLVFTQRYKEMDRYQVKEQPWARLIPEDEIEFEEYGPMEFRYGRWRGREVDVYKVWMDRDLKFLNRAMKAYRRLQDTSLTYDLLGHLICPITGSIIGIVTEPMLGRRITLHDAPLVYSALHDLNSIGYILDTPHEGSMLVTSSGELKIIAMHNVLPLPTDLKEREERIWKREEWCRKWVFGEDAKRRYGGVGERPFERAPAESQGRITTGIAGPHTRGKLILPIRVVVPYGEPEKVLFLESREEERRKWAVEKFRDRWSAVNVNDVQEIWKSVRAGGVKRLLEEADSGSEDGAKKTSVSVRRPGKKLKGKGKERERSETPLPRLPVAVEDLPVMPPAVFDIQEYARDRSTSQTVFGLDHDHGEGGWSSRSPTVRSSPIGSPAVSGSRNCVDTKNVSSWLLEGNWLELASKSRFDIVE